MFVENLGREIVWGSTKLEELGFKYKHDINNILDGSFKHARKLGLIILLFGDTVGRQNKGDNSQSSNPE